MVAERKKKFATGEAAQFITRKRALKKLQLPLKTFQRLCILKGIYPREPRSRKRAQKGQGGIKTLYHMKDIQFLMHEPVIWTLRDLKVYYRRLGRARTLHEHALVRKYLKDHPTLKLDHIVKERYPTFIDALRDLDDCLTLCFLFSTFPSIKHVPRHTSRTCQQLTIEFLHAIMESRALRKVFISIKGYYYQVEIQGVTITWIVPHNFSFQPQKRSEVDFPLMATFVEFYITMLGFVNFRLFNMLNLIYPPKLALSSHDNDTDVEDEEEFVAERVAALNHRLAGASNTVKEDVQFDYFDLSRTEYEISAVDPSAAAAAEFAKEAHSVQTLKHLFEGKRFYLNREVPREPFVFVIRCFGGVVSWDKNLYTGATYDEDDETITYQIVDRPSIPKQYISRYYVQPQWVFDCVNARRLLPVHDYLIGAVLPPHLSPFTDPTKDQQYIPPEEQALIDAELLKEFQRPGEGEGESADESDAEVTNKQMEETDSNDESAASKLRVSVGKTEKITPQQTWERNRQERLLRQKMVPNKHRKLFRSMVKGKSKRLKEVWLLRKKRRLLDGKTQADKTRTPNKTLANDRSH